MASEPPNSIILEEAKIEDDEEGSPNKLSQQLSSLSVSKTDNILDDPGFAEFLDILADQEARKFNELLDSLEGAKMEKLKDESISQDTSADVESIKPSISSLITDDEELTPKKRSLSQDSVDGARPLKIRRVEPNFEERFGCTLCSASYTDEEQMKFHKHRHRLKKPILFWCNSCHLEFAKRRTMIKHVKSFHRDCFTQCFKCKNCSQIFISRSDAGIHHFIKCGIHPIEDPTLEKYIEPIYIKYMYTCEYCYKSFSGMTSLLEHKNKYHHAGDSCKNCDKHQVDQKEKDLDSFHNFGIRTRFACRYCTKLFIHFNSLIYHQLEHSDHKFHCSMCNEKFCTWESIKKHRETEHTYQIIYREKTARICVCCCGMEFDDEETFMVHEKRHFTGITLYEVRDDKTISKPVRSMSSLNESLESLFENLTNSPDDSSLLYD